MIAGSTGFNPFEILIILVYLGVVAGFSWLGYRRTKTSSDYLIAGRKSHPFVMAMSYGATFISTSAIVGFGGVAGLFGMSLLWLTFLNILLGIFIAFVFLGGKTRRLGHCLDAHTFPELLGRRYESKLIQVIAGMLIFAFIPLYAGAVLIGASVFIQTHMGVSYHTALNVFTFIITLYVVVGGLKGVMYTDAFQGTIMFVAMLVLLITTYVTLGGVTTGHQQLSELADLVPAPFQAIGHRGWTQFPAFGFGDEKYNLWWIMVGTIILGVGIGVLAQPQLVVRFMTVKSGRELNRAALVGGLFILVIPGTAYTVGSLSNAYFVRNGEPISGHIVKMIDVDKGHCLLQPIPREERETASDGTRPIPVVLLEEDRNRPGKPLVAGMEVRGRSLSWVYAGQDADQIIPTYITQAMPAWFQMLFLLTLLSAAMSTLSSQFHALGTSIGRDVFDQLLSRKETSMLVARMSTVVGILIAFIIARQMRGGYIVARATSIFFGLCSSAFLPAYLGGLYWRRMTRAGAISSIVVGSVVSALWLLLVKAKEAGAIGLVQHLTHGKTSILADYPNWPVVDPILVALPLSCLTAVAVSLLTRKPADTLIRKCFI